MKNSGPDHYDPIKTALKLAGFDVDTVRKRGKKTVITVSGQKQSGGSPVSDEEPFLQKVSVITAKPEPVQDETGKIR